VEGGPYGLYIATILGIELLLLKRFWYLIVFFAVLAFSYSKAGYVLFSICVALYFFLNVKQLKSFINPKNKVQFSFFVLFSFCFLGMAIGFIASNYIQNIKDVESLLVLRKDDPSFVMGRIAAMYIGSNIIELNPFFGVGLGNYSLVRNADVYRGNFPVVDEWDLTGLGGIITLLFEGGLIGIFLFILAVRAYINNDRISFALLILFLLPFFLGAQLYMIYPWVFLGFLILHVKDIRKNENLY
jgi:hypothetical protein